MDAKIFLELSDAFFGVPDSQLKPLCTLLLDEYGISKKHIIAANEGCCTALAAGYYLSTGKIPLVYMQNSGIGNIINPVASLLNDKVYGIPCIFVVGWRGEPGVKDEPQHIYQGEVTVKLLEDMDIATYIVSADTTEDDIHKQMDIWSSRFSEGKSVAFIIRKGVLTCDRKVKQSNDNAMTREEIIKQITDISGEDIIVSTTGKASRELFELREASNRSHKYDFLTVGSMGHSSSIALEIALNKPSSRVWCIDGDGALLMHMGAMALIGANKPDNLIHCVINNGAHETVGGMPTVANKIDWLSVARGCGYKSVESVDTPEALRAALENAKANKHLTFIEIKSNLLSRSDLGRPTTTAKQNKENFMNYLKEI